MGIGDSRLKLCFAVFDVMERKDNGKFLNLLSKFKFLVLYIVRVFLFQIKIFNLKQILFICFVHLFSVELNTTMLRVKCCPNSGCAQNYLSANLELLLY